MFIYEYVVGYDFDGFSVSVPVSVVVDALGDDWSVRADELARRVLLLADVKLPFDSFFTWDANLLQVSGGY